MKAPDISEGTAQNLLHALVIAIRDDKHRYNLKRIAACYPRITNKTNPFLSLLKENERLQGIADNYSEQMWSLRDKITSLENSLEYYKGKCKE